MAIQLRQRSNAAQFIERGYNLLPLSYPARPGHIRSSDRIYRATLALAILSCQRAGEAEQSRLDFGSPAGAPLPGYGADFCLSGNFR